MELPSPLTLLYTYTHPLLSSPTLHSTGSIILVGLYVTHYINRAIISPRRTPSRSPSNVIVPLAAIVFNLLNGSLNGAYLATLNGPMSLTFWLGIIVFVAGFVGNVVHDEVLLRLRQGSKGGSGDRKTPKYSIPYGGLYKYISYAFLFAFTHLHVPLRIFTQVSKLLL